MCSLLLKKALPFALTLVLGSFIGGLFKSVGIGGHRTEPARAYFDAYGDGHRHSCRMRYRGRDLVAETKPLTILFKPDARWPRELEVERNAFNPVRLSATFGADGKVSAVTPTNGCFSDNAVGQMKPLWDAATRAALMIEFEPEMVNGLPVTVTREVEIRFMDE